MKSILLLCLIFLSCPIFSSEFLINISKTSVNENRDVFELDLLKFLLQKSGVTSKFIFTKPMSQERVSEELKKGTLDIYWMGTSNKLETGLIPIRFPIYRGLLGYRIFIINKKNINKFKKIKNLNDLQQLVGIQDRGWNDIPILTHSGLKPIEAPYKSIYKMLDAGRNIDYFSRGMTEAYNELEGEIKKLPNLMVEENILLTYKYPLFYFISPHNKVLSNTLHKAFKQSFDDGSFFRFFNSHKVIINALKKVNLSSRVKINILNPFLSKETEQLGELYWYSL